MAAADPFNPRLRLDLSSGQNSLRSLRESAKRLHAGRDPVPLDDGFASLPPVVDYEKAIALMRGRHTHDMHERHIGSLRKIASINTRGFYLQDVAAASELVRLAAERLAAGLAEYEVPIVEVLGALSVPFQKSRSNDDNRYEASVLDLLRTAASLCASAPPAVASAALEMILALAVPPPPPTSSAETLAREAMALGPRVPALHLLRLVIKAGIVHDVVGAIARADAEASPIDSSSRSGSFLGRAPAWHASTIASMRLLRSLSRDPDGAAAIVGAPHLPALLARLSLPLGQPALHLAVEITWNLLEAAPSAAAATLCTVEGVARLTELHRRTLAAGASETDRELRNEVLVLSTLLARNAPPEAMPALLEGGLYSAVLELVCCDSARIVQPSEVNHELMLFSLQFLIVVSALTASSAAAADEARRADDDVELSSSLVRCIASDGADEASFTLPIAAGYWSASQRLELKKKSFKLLTNLAVASPSTVSSDVSLPSLLSSFLCDEAPQPLRDASIEMLLVLLPTSTDFQLACCDCGCVAQLIELVSAVTFCGNPTSLAPFSTVCVATTAALRLPSGLAASAMVSAVIALALLCTDQPECQKRFGEAGGVASLLPLLKPRTDESLLHAVIECVWSAVVPSASNVARLVERDGVLQMLDMLVGASFAPRAHVLSCISDLVSQHPAALEQCTEWRGPERQSCAQLCLRLWAEEEARRGGAAGTGIIRSATRPLSTSGAADFVDLNASLVIDEPSMQPPSNDAPIGVGGWADDGDGAGHHPNNSAELLTLDGGLAVASPSGGGLAQPGALKLTTSAGLQISGRISGAGTVSASANGHVESFERGDVRSKLFSLLNCVGFGADEELSSAEELLVTAAKKFVPFALSEVYRDAADGLAADGVVPLAEDQSKLEARLASDEAAVELIIAEQGGLLERMADADADAEVAELKRVRVLRDGPMGQLQTTKRGSSLFRARIEAKAKIGAMVAASKVAYRGAMPTMEEYADATVLAAAEAMLEAGLDPTTHGFTLRHIPQALSTLASAASIDPAKITPFLAEAGVGLTATGRAVESPATLKVRVSPDGRSGTVETIPLIKDKLETVTPERLRQLCIEFQMSVDAAGGA